MNIRGFQKLTLLDFPGKTACTVFTGGCNMRCPFCHNSDLVLSAQEYPEIDENEVFSLLEKRKSLLDGVCITGGEPMLNKDLPQFCEKIKRKGFLVKIDTNGTFPGLLKSIVNEKLCDYVAVDFKNSPEKYPMTVGVPDFDFSKVGETVEFLKTGAVDHEFRTTVSKTYHTKEDILTIVRLLGEGQKYFIQAYRDSEQVMDRSTEGFSPSELRDILTEAKKINPLAEVRGI